MGGLPLTLTVALTTGQHYRAACDRVFVKIRESDDPQGCRANGWFT